MSIILLIAVAFAAAIASAVLIIRWALSRDRPPPGFPVGNPVSDRERKEDPRP